MFLAAAWLQIRLLLELGHRLAGSDIEGRKRPNFQHAANRPKRYEGAKRELGIGLHE